MCDNPTIIYPYIRNLFRERCNFNMLKGKRIFITRNGSNSIVNAHSHDLLRIILNEDKLINMLSKYNFEYIQLDKYDMYNKIKLFMESETIISTHSSALTMCLFIDTNAKIIEILNNGTAGVGNEHYRFLSKALNLNYHRYSNIREDIKGNFTLNIPEFETYITNIM